MDQEITPEQKAHLETWAGQRDAILSEISGLQTVKEELQKNNQAISDSSTEIENRIVFMKGQIEELSIKDKELPLLISKEVASLEYQKSTLESEITTLTKLVKVLSEQKDSIVKDTYLLTEIYNTINERVGVLDKVVDHVTKVSEQNKFVIEDLIESIKTSSQAVIDINKKNVSETNMVLEKLPAMLVELQKQKLIRHNI